MSRSIVLSNGELCVALDAKAQVRDIYFPHVGYEDHVRGHYIHRVGVWVEGRMSWLGEDPAWNISVLCEEEALASTVAAHNQQLGVTVEIKDIVYNERPVFIRRVTVTNASERMREIKLYFGHQFEIYKSHGSDTAYFDPAMHAIIHYKGHRVFLIGASQDGTPFDDYATGRNNFQGREGTHRDADDGVLSKNPIEHGPADSVIGLYGSYAPNQSRITHYYIVAAQSIAEAKALNGYVLSKTPQHLVETATKYWHAWLTAHDVHVHDLNAAHIRLFKQSLMYMRAHVDAEGGIVASIDSDMLQYGLDTYSYVWPRDSAYTSLAFDAAGDSTVPKRFFEFCRDTISEEGYFYHKYLPDKSLGSSWHPWIEDGEPQLPIQEDETAIVICAFAEHYARSHDLEFLELLFNPLIEKAADFLVRYRDEKTKLPLPSYDLWERKRGVSTYTASAVYGALVAAAKLAKVLGKDSHEARYLTAAAEVQSGIMKELWDEKGGYFINMLQYKKGAVSRDETVDASSAYGLFFFGVLQPSDARLVSTWDRTLRVLSHGISSGGIARFEHDDYYRIDGPAPGNPWVITTLWYAEYLIAAAKTLADLERVSAIFSWVVQHAQPSGVLSEQLNPNTGVQVCAAPLTWSHAGYVSAVLKYLHRMEELGGARMGATVPSRASV